MQRSGISPGSKPGFHPLVSLLVPLFVPFHHHSPVGHHREDGSLITKIDDVAVFQ